jgi:hypothetical protein
MRAFGKAIGVNLARRGAGIHQGQLSEEVRASVMELRFVLRWGVAKSACCRVLCLGTDLRRRCRLPVAHRSGRAAGTVTHFSTLFPDKMTQVSLVLVADRLQ